MVKESSKDSSNAAYERDLVTNNHPLLILLDAVLLTTL